MKFKSNSNQDFELAPEGNHVAICNAIVDLGVQPGTTAYPSPKHQVYVRFELCNELVTREGKTGPVVIGKTFTASMHEKASLRKFIEGWFGKKFPSDFAAEDFDLSKLLGRQCLANVTHYHGSDGKERAGLDAVAQLPKGMATDVSQFNASLFFDLNNANDKDYAQLPDWLKKKVDARIEEKPLQSTPDGPDAGDVQDHDEFGDRIPF